MNKLRFGFSLIELLIVMAVIGILIGIMTVGLSEAKKSSRDTRRKADLETIRQGIELYKTDCNAYPPALTDIGTALAGTYGGTTYTCTYYKSVFGNFCPPQIVTKTVTNCVTECAFISDCSQSTTCVANAPTSPSSCKSSNIYISSMPGDPLNPSGNPSNGRVYLFSSLGTSYEICASLEGGGATVSCGGSNNCGTGATCNYRVTSP